MKANADTHRVGLIKDSRTAMSGAAKRIIDGCHDSSNGNTEPISHTRASFVRNRRAIKLNLVIGDRANFEYFRFIFACTFRHFCKRESTPMSTMRYCKYDDFVRPLPLRRNLISRIQS